MKRAIQFRSEGQIAWLQAMRLCSVALFASVASAVVGPAAAQPALFDARQLSYEGGHHAGPDINSDGLDAVGPSAGPGDAIQGPSGVQGWRLPDLRGRSQLNVDVSGRMRYDTDATQGTQAFILGRAGPAVSSTALRRQADWSFFTTASLTHQYAFGRLRNTVWETDARLSDQRFFRISHNFDATYTEANTGPRLSAGRIGRGTVTVRPFGSLAWLGYGDRTYASLYGGGLSARFETPGWNVALTGLGRFANHENTAIYTSSRLSTGPEFRVFVASSLRLDPRTDLGTELWWFQRTGRIASFSYQGPGAIISINRRFIVLGRASGGVLYGSVQRLNYGRAATEDRSSARREDTYWSGGISFAVPVSRSKKNSVLSAVTAVAEYQYLHYASTIFPFSNHVFMVGVKIGL